MENENAKLKKLLAEAELKKGMLNEIAAKSASEVPMTPTSEPRLPQLAVQRRRFGYRRLHILISGKAFA